MPRIQGVQVGQAVPPVSFAALPFNHLSASNPDTVNLVARVPELGQFLQRQAAVGAIAEPAAGLVATDCVWNLWFHSPKSLSQRYAWQDQLVFIYQERANETVSLDFGGAGRARGQLLAVYRLGDLAIDLVPQQVLATGTAPDGGFLTQVKFKALGRLGDTATVWFATGCLDANGCGTGGWGLGLGYSGRAQQLRHGTGVEIPIHEDDHVSFTVLRPNADGSWRQQPAPRPQGLVPPSWHT